MLVFSRKATPYFIGFWVLSSIYDHFQHPNFSFRINLKWTLLITSLFIVYLVFYLFSDFSKEASKALEIKASFLVVPSALLLRKKQISKKELQLIFLSFQVACLCSATYLISKLVPALLNQWNSLKPEEFTYAIRTFMENTLGIHPTYLSIYYLFSIYLVATTQGIELITTNRRIIIAFKIFAIILLSTICILMVARAPLLAFVFSLVAVATLKNWKKGLFSMLIAAIVSIASIALIPSIGNRFKEVIESEAINEKTNSVNSSNLRKSILSCSKLIISDNWLGGVGLDNVQKELNNCYDTYGNKELSNRNYNSHNQYFDVILSLGILGFILFIIILLFPFFGLDAFNYSSFLFFKLFMLICFVTENILNRQHGIVFFVVFNCLYISNYLWFKNQLSKPKMNENIFLESLDNQ
mgnify:FL=1